MRKIEEDRANKKITETHKKRARSDSTNTTNSITSSGDDSNEFDEKEE